MSKEKPMKHRELVQYLAQLLIPKWAAREYYDKRLGRYVVEFRNIW